MTYQLEKDSVCRRLANGSTLSQNQEPRKMITGSSKKKITGINGYNETTGSVILIHTCVTNLRHLRNLRNGVSFLSGNVCRVAHLSTAKRRKNENMPLRLSEGCTKSCNTGLAFHSHCSSLCPLGNQTLK